MKTTTIIITIIITSSAILATTPPTGWPDNVIGTVYGTNDVPANTGLTMPWNNNNAYLAYTTIPGLGFCGVQMRPADGKSYVWGSFSNDVFQPMGTFAYDGGFRQLNDAKGPAWLGSHTNGNIIEPTWRTPDEAEAFTGYLDSADGWDFVALWQPGYARYQATSPDGEILTVQKDTNGFTATYTDLDGQAHSAGTWQTAPDNHFVCTDPGDIALLYAGGSVLTYAPVQWNWNWPLVGETMCYGLALGGFIGAARYARAK